MNIETNYKKTFDKLNKYIYNVKSNKKKVQEVLK